MHTIPRALAPLTFIISLVYNTSVHIRNSLYNASILPLRRLDNPVISIGNITTGGTGKTPLVIFTAKKLVELGFIPVILSRGYGRSDPGVSLIIPPGKHIRSPAHELGDEPALIRLHVPEAWFGLSKDRFIIGSRIERTGGRMVFILDDGFQHRRLHRDLDIVVIDASQPLGSNRLLPGGTLREPLSGLARCDAVIINNAQDSERTVDSVSSEILCLQSEAALFHCEQSIKKLIPFTSWNDPEKAESYNPSIKSAFLVAALGNPSRFQTDVLKLGIRVSGSRFFKDHYRLRPQEWQDCIHRARETGAEAIITSEKDAVKVSEPPDFPLLVTIQTTRFVNEDSFIKILRRCTLEREHVER
jgi:tetraacyldisaccharide 4'-kinase